jgi:hypothetical protein
LCTARRRNTVPTKRQFADIYDRKLYKTTVYIIIFGRLDHRNHRPGYISDISILHLRLVIHSVLKQTVKKRLSFFFLETHFITVLINTIQLNNDKLKGLREEVSDHSKGKHR